MVAADALAGGEHLQDHKPEAAAVGGAELGEQRVHDGHAAEADADDPPECQQRLRRCSEARARAEVRCGVKGRVSALIVGICGRNRGVR